MMIDQKALEAAVEAMRDCHAPDACAAVAVAITAYEAAKQEPDKEPPSLKSTPSEGTET